MDERRAFAGFQFIFSPSEAVHDVYDVTFQYVVESLTVERLGRAFVSEVLCLPEEGGPRWRSERSELRQCGLAPNLWG